MRFLLPNPVDGGAELTRRGLGLGGCSFGEDDSFSCNKLRL